VGIVRPCAQESTLIQMLGRGLRTVDPRRYPGIVKADCVVLDFGRSLLEHGGIEQVCDLDGRPPVATDGVAPMRQCPECGAHCPVQCRWCPICGFEFPRTARQQVEAFGMTEFELFEQSPFRWMQMNERCFAATGLTAWSIVFRAKGMWHAFGGGTGLSTQHLQSGELPVCLACGDDHLSEHGDAKQARKTRAWLSKPLTAKQAELLGISPLDFTVSRYEANCRLVMRWNRRAIGEQLKKVVAATDSM